MLEGRGKKTLKTPENWRKPSGGLSCGDRCAPPAATAPPGCPPSPRGNTGALKLSPPRRPLLPAPARKGGKTPGIGPKMCRGGPAGGGSPVSPLGVPWCVSPVGTPHPHGETEARAPFIPHPRLPHSPRAAGTPMSPSAPPKQPPSPGHLQPVPGGTSPAGVAGRERPQVTWGQEDGCHGGGTSGPVASRPPRGAGAANGCGGTKVPPKRCHCV